MADADLGYAYVPDSTLGLIYKLDTNNGQDNGSDIVVDIITNRYDMDTYKRKFMSNVRIVGDRYAAGSYVTIRWTDDDYQTWSNYKQVYLDDDFPNWSRLGSFRRRAFMIRHVYSSGLRLECIEVTYTIGES